MKRIIFTCVTDGIDNLQDPKETCDAEYICFTEDKISSKVWKPVPLLKRFKCPRLTARYHKTIGANELDADISLWQDGKVTFLRSPEEFFQRGIKLFLHPKRQCIYDEAIRVIHLKKDDPSTVKKQTRKYRKEGMPTNQGLYETAIVVRDKTMRELNKLWWQEIKNESIRDQISLPYLLWKHKVKPAIFDIDYYSNDLFEVTEHPFINHLTRIKLL